MNSPPRFGTPRRPDRPTLGAATAAVAAQLGRPLLPWQRHVADVAGELVDGKPAYSTIVVSVPRRGGKSLLLLATMLRCILTARGRQVWYTAQDGSNVTRTWRQQWAPIVSTSPLDAVVRTRLSQGREEFEVRGVGSFASAFAPLPTSLHGQDGDLIVFDEAWAFPASRGRQLEVAAEPTMATRPGAQMWILSAAGDSDSTWLAEWVDAASAAVELDLGHGIAGFDWSADPKVDDLDDPAVWARVHPAVRSESNPHGTIDMQFLADRHGRDADLFRRAYLNIPDISTGHGTLIDTDVFARLATDPIDLANLTAGVVFAVDSAPDQQWTSIVAATFLDGVPIVELVERRDGHAWAVDRLVELAGTYRTTCVALDGGSPAGVLTAGLRRAGLPLRLLELRDITAAAGQFVGAVATGDVRHVPDPQLDAAVAAARRRTIGDGSWAFGRRAANVDVSPLIAACFARYALVDTPEPGIS